MDAAQLVLEARRRAGLSQRALAERSGVAQPTIAKIERRRADATVATVERLLAACGLELQLVEVPGAGTGVDRKQMRELLRLRPVQRLELLRRDAEGLDQLVASAER